jgi:hypothetical protein
VNDDDESSLEPPKEQQQQRSTTTRPPKPPHGNNYNNHDNNEEIAKLDPSDEDKSEKDEAKADNKEKKKESHTTEAKAESYYSQSDRNPSPKTQKHTLPTTHIERADAEGFKTSPPLTCFHRHPASVCRMYSLPTYHLTCAKCDHDIKVDDIVSICHACEPMFLACQPCSNRRLNESTDNH